MEAAVAIRASCLRFVTAAAGLALAEIAVDPAQQRIG